MKNLDVSLREFLNVGNTVESELPVAEAELINAELHALKGKLIEIQQVIHI